MQRPSVPQLNGVHDWPAVCTQAPAPSQRNADVSVDPAQAISWQTVPAGELVARARAVAHAVDPQVDAASTGALIARVGADCWALTQVPTVPWSVQVTHVPVQAVLQQTPSAQKPLAHSPAIAHEEPIGFPGASMAASAG